MTVSDEAGPDRSTADPESPTVGQRRPAEDRDRRDRTDRSATDGGSSASTANQSAVAVYRWTCPICGESRTGIAAGDETPRAKAAFSLRQHVQTSEDDGHGPANEYPPDFDPDAAGRAVSVD